MSDSKTFKDPEKQSFSKVFILLTACLCLALVAEVYLELIGRQPWKQFQNEFKELELKKLEGELKVARDKFYAKEKLLSQSPAGAEPTSLENYRKRLEQAEKLVSSNHYRDALAQLSALKGQVEDNKVHHQFIKADLDAAYYQYDLAKEEKHNTTSLSKTIEEIKVKLQENEKKEAILATRILEAQDKVKGVEDEIEEIKRAMDAQTFEVVRLEQAIAKVKARSPEINQIVVSYLGEYQSVDRCVTCHAGIDRADFEKSEKLVFRAHPK